MRFSFPSSFASRRIPVGTAFRLERHCQIWWQCDCSISQPLPHEKIACQVLFYSKAIGAGYTRHGNDPQLTCSPEHGVHYRCMGYWCIALLHHVLARSGTAFQPNDIFMYMYYLFEATWNRKNTRIKFIAFLCPWHFWHKFCDTANELVCFSYGFELCHVLLLE